MRLGQVLLREQLEFDDTSLEYLRVDGEPGGTIVCCLPWRMTYRVAAVAGLVPRRNLLACYEMPQAVVSSEPELCVRAVNLVADDALRTIARARVSPANLLVVGLSIGNSVATLVANRLGARLYSVCSADRGDLTLWQSAAAAHVKARALEKGYGLDDFTRALVGLNTIDNLANLPSSSRFVISKRDEFVPEPRREGLITAV